MYWANFLGMFLAETKSDDAVRRITDTAYRPLVALLRANPGARLTLNLSGTLADRLARTGGRDVLDGIRALAVAGQVELTGSAASNTLLNLLEAAEIRGLIERNRALLEEHLGDAFRPRGFFPPNMAYSRTVAETAHALGYEWILVDEMGHTGKPGTIRHDRLYVLRGLPELRVFFRDRSLSTGLAYGAFKTAGALIAAMATLPDHDQPNAFLLTGNDAELYGHHRRGGDQQLAEFYAGPIESRTVSALLDLGLEEEEADPLPSTWSAWEVLQF